MSKSERGSDGDSQECRQREWVKAHSEVSAEALALTACVAGDGKRRRKSTVMTNTYPYVCVCMYMNTYMIYK